MAILTQTLSANTTIAIDLSNLPTSGSFTTGRESAQVDNTTTNYVDAIVNVKGIAGHATTAPTAVGQLIALYVWGADTSLATTAIDVLVGTDAARTLSHGSVLNSLRAPGGASVTVLTAALTYYIQPFSVAALFGGVMPKYWGLYVAHNHAGALAAAQTGKFSFNGVTYTST